jgi:hypothetical protein
MFVYILKNTNHGEGGLPQRNPRTKQTTPIAFGYMYVLIRSANKEILDREYRNWIAFFQSANSEDANEGSANKELLL